MTWQSETMTRRDLFTRWIRFKSPAQLIRDVAALVPKDVWRLTFICASNDKRPSLDVAFYASDQEAREGIQTIALVEIHQTDAPLFVLYLASLRPIGMLCCELPKPDDGGGEELPVPTISQAALVALAPATASVQ